VIELPCIYAFTSKDKRLLQKARKRLEEEGKQVDNDVWIEKEVAVTNKPTVTDSTTLSIVETTTICISELVKDNVSFTTVTTATPAVTSIATFCINSYAVQVNS